MRGPKWSSNVSRCLDLLRGHLRLFVGLPLGLDSCTHPRIASCRVDDFLVALASGTGFICDLQRLWDPSRIAEYRGIHWHRRYRNGLVVAYGSARQPALEINARGGSRLLRVIRPGWVTRLALPPGRMSRQCFASAPFRPPAVPAI
jgi:hypothetical protein